MYCISQPPKRYTNAKPRYHDYYHIILVSILYSCRISFQRLGVINAVSLHPYNAI
jgi:hypothetical protein